MTNLLSPEEARQYGVTPPEGPAPSEAGSPAPPPLASLTPTPCFTSWQCLTASALVSRGPLLLYGVQASAAAAGLAADLYDGVNTSGRLVLRLRAAANDVPNVDFSHPIYLQNGLWAELNANAFQVLIRYIPLSG